MSFSWVLYVYILYMMNHYEKSIFFPCVFLLPKTKHVMANFVKYDFTRSICQIINSLSLFCLTFVIFDVDQFESIRATAYFVALEKCKIQFSMKLRQLLTKHISFQFVSTERGKMLLIWALWQIVKPIEIHKIWTRVIQLIWICTAIHWRQYRIWILTDLQKKSHFLGTWLRINGDEPRLIGVVDVIRNASSLNSSLGTTCISHLYSAYTHPTENK